MIRSYNTHSKTTLSIFQNCSDEMYKVELSTYLSGGASQNWGKVLCD